MRETPLGPLCVAVSERGLASLELQTGLADFLQHVEAVPDPQHELVREALRQMGEYLNGQRQVFDLPLDWSQMGAFQQSVLRLTLAIPFGEVRTYGSLAQEMGKPRAARAVGAAEGANPVPVIIPCHRMVGSEGGLHGYGAPGGLDTKAWLLTLEGHQLKGHKLLR